MKSFDELFALNQAAAGRLQAVAEPAVPALTPAVADPAAPVVAAVTGAAVIPPALRKEGRSLASGWSTQASTVPGRFSYVVNSVHPVPEVFYFILSPVSHQHCFSCKSLRFLRHTREFRIFNNF